MELYDVMRTAFSARDFTDEPIDDEVLYRILDHARFAPSGGNRQGWRVIVVRDERTRDAFKDLIRPAFKRYRAQVEAGENPWNPVVPSAITDDDVAAADVPEAFIARLTGAPVLLVVCIDLRVVAAMDQFQDRIGVVPGASIYPFVWNILLAAHNEGLGGTLTTFIAAEEPSVRTLLGLPEELAVAAMLPIGHPAQRLTRLRRNAVEHFTSIDRLDGPAFGKP